MVPRRSGARTAPLTAQGGPHASGSPVVREALNTSSPSLVPRTKPETLQRPSPAGFFAPSNEDRTSASARTRSAQHTWRVHDFSYPATCDLDRSPSTAFRTFLAGDSGQRPLPRRPSAAGQAATFCPPGRVRRAVPGTLWQSDAAAACAWQLAWRILARSEQGACQWQAPCPYRLGASQTDPAVTCPRDAALSAGEVMGLWAKGPPLARASLPGSSASPRCESITAASERSCLPSSARRQPPDVLRRSEAAQHGGMSAQLQAPRTVPVQMWHVYR